MEKIHKQVESWIIVYSVGYISCYLSILLWKVYIIVKFRVGKKIISILWVLICNCVCFFQHNVNRTHLCFSLLCCCISELYLLTSSFKCYEEWAVQAISIMILKQFWYKKIFALKYKSNPKPEFCKQTNVLGRSVYDRR